MEALKEAYTITKDALQRDLKWKIHELESGKEVDEFKNHSAAFRNLYISLTKRFREKIDKTFLEMIMETKEREKFELYLISNPLIKATEEHFGSFA